MCNQATTVAAAVAIAIVGITLLLTAVLLVVVAIDFYLKAFSPQKIKLEKSFAPKRPSDQSYRF